MLNNKLDLHDIKKLVPESMFHQIIKQAWYGDPDWLIELINSVGESIEEIAKHRNEQYWDKFYIFFLNHKPEDFAIDLIYHQLRIEARKYNPSPEEQAEKEQYNEDGNEIIES